MAGRKNGQTKVVREGDVGVAYSWNAKEYNWDRVSSEVTGHQRVQYRWDTVTGERTPRRVRSGSEEAFKGPQPFVNPSMRVEPYPPVPQGRH